MTPKEAAFLLDISPDVSADEIRVRFRELYAHFRSGMENAPTTLLRREYSQNLRDLQRACEVLGVDVSNEVEPISGLVKSPASTTELIDGVEKIAAAKSAGVSKAKTAKKKGTVARFIRRTTIFCAFSLTLVAVFIPDQVLAVADKTGKGENFYDSLLYTHLQMRKGMAKVQSWLSQAPVADVYESNNDRKTARLLEAGEYHNLNITVGDEDWYFTHVPEGHRLRIGLFYKRAGGLLHVEVYDGEKSIGRASRTENGEELYLKDIKSGNYFVVVKGESQVTNDYWLEVVPEPQEKLKLVSSQVFFKVEDKEQYTTTFPHTTQEIFWKLELDNLWRMRSHRFMLAWQLRGPDGQVKSREEKRVAKDQIRYVLEQKLREAKGTWALGSYQLDVWVDDEKFATTPFIVSYDLSEQEQKAIHEVEKAIRLGQDQATFAYEKNDHSNLPKIEQYIEEAKRGLEILKDRGDHPRVVELQQQYDKLVADYQRIYKSGRAKDLDNVRDIVQQGMEHCKEAMRGNGEALKRAIEYHQRAGKALADLQKENFLQSEVDVVRESVDTLEKEIVVAQKKVQEFQETDVAIKQKAQVARVAMAKSTKVTKLARSKINRKYLLKADKFKQKALKNLQEMRELRDNHPLVKDIFGEIEKLSSEIRDAETYIGKKEKQREEELRRREEDRQRKLAEQKEGIGREFRKAQKAIRKGLAFCKSAIAQKNAGSLRKSSEQREIAANALENMKKIRADHPHIASTRRHLKELDREIKKAREIIRNRREIEAKISSEAQTANKILYKANALCDRARETEEMEYLVKAANLRKQALVHLKAMRLEDPEHSLVIETTREIQKLTDTIREIERKIKDQKQVWYSQPVFPKKKIEAHWQRGYIVTALAYDDKDWGMVLTKGRTPQIWHKDGYFPKKQIEDGWKRGYAVSHLSYGERAWAVIMSKQAVAQFWHTEGVFPQKQIEEGWKRGYRVTDLAFGNDKWGMIMTKGYLPQIWHKDAAFPKGKIEDGWKSGYIVTNLACDNGSWAVVMTKGDRAQIWHKDASFPEARIIEGIERGYEVSSLVYGNRTWALIMSK